MEACALSVRDLNFAYNSLKPVLQISEWNVQKGARVFLHGPSGTGKTTLLGLITGVLTPNSGSVRLLGEPFSELSVSQRDTFRGDHIGYIFQMFNLIPYLSVVENILLPVQMSSVRKKRLPSNITAEDEARRLCEALKIGNHAHRKVTDLSVGQQQRVACARALMGWPSLLVADEPTSALDADTRLEFLDLLFAQCEMQGTTVLFVSHDKALESRFDTSVSLRDLNQVKGDSH